MNQEQNNEIFYVSSENEYFSIAFDQLFENEKLRVYNDFDITSKRHFKNLANEILETYNELFLVDGKFNEDTALTILKLLSSQTKIIVKDTDPNMPLTDFFKIINDIVYSGDELLLNLIHNYIEEHYSLELDTITENMKSNKKTVNDELFISDSSAKLYLEISYLSRLLIPVISQYLVYNKSAFPQKQILSNEVVDEEGEELIFEEATFSIFKYIFDIVAKENAESLRNKLYKMSQSRIVKTIMPAARYWQVASNLGITVHTETNEIYKKLLTNAMTKLKCSPDLNIVSYFTAVIKKQTDFLFQNKFKYHYQTIDFLKSDTSNDDDMSEFEKLEIRNARKDEGNLILQQLVINDIVKKLPDILDVSVTEDEVQENVAKVSKNTIQAKIISLIVTKYFEDTSSLSYLTAEQYSKVLICCRKYLEKHKFVLLTQILSSKCEKHRERVGITGNKIKQKIEESKKYTVLFDKKYKYFKESIDKQLSSMILNLF